MCQLVAHLRTERDQNVFVRRLDMREPAYRLSIAELREASDVGVVAHQLEKPLRWRNERDGRELMVAIVLRNRAAASAVAPLVRQIDDWTAAHLDRSRTLVYCAFPDSLVPSIDTLAEADTRLPRLEIVRIVDRPLEVESMREMSDEATAAEEASLVFRPYLQLAASRDIARLGDMTAFRQFPVVEVTGAFATSDADPIAQFWSAHPQLQHSTVRSLGGRVDTFFRLFELACLAELGAPLATVEGERDLIEALPSFLRWARRTDLLRSEPRACTSILEHDVDLLADSHECQSPVFVHASLDRRRKADHSSEPAP